ncbi:MAG: hypothetical protein KH452_11700 [Clostridiales bacterium]|nr:hypothetical protein [Clostridiales bacterium]
MKGYIMKKRGAFWAGMLALSMVLSGCGNNTTDTSKAETNGTQSSSQQESTVIENSEQLQSDASAEGENEQNVSSLEDCKLRLIDCHQFQLNDEQFTYLAFALQGPADIGFHLESATSEAEVSDAWLEINDMGDGWRMVISKELPEGITLEDLSLSITDYSTSEEKTVLHNDWGEPMSKEELQTIGVYEIEGHLAVVGKGMPTIVSGTYGIGVGLGLIGPEFGNPDNSFPQLDNPAEVFHFYASDGTPLAEKVGKEMDCYMINNNVYAMFPLEDGADKNAEVEKLLELSPYMEYTNAEGESFQFSLEKNK